MFGVDFSEIALIFLIALVVLGPAKLPQVAATVGRWIGRARMMARQFREQLEQEASTLREATEVRSRPAPPPRPSAPVPPEPVAVEPAAVEAAAVEAAPDTAAAADTPASLEATPVAQTESDPEPAPLDHPAPLPAEPHERGA